MKSGRSLGEAGASGKGDHLENKGAPVGTGGGRTCFSCGRVWQVVNPLDADAMRAGAAHLLGKHDFTTFRSTYCQAASPVKTLDEISIVEHSYPAGVEYRFTLRARSFLHNQVRSIVGTLERVGAGAWAAADVKTALEAMDRQACGPVSPPDGLYMTGVGYPVDPFAGLMLPGALPPDPRDI